jgi:CRISPR/Cas system-associated exonuclease Cas4 (RecB family)
MSKYYNSQRTRGLFDPISNEPFGLSRSKVDLFVQCPRCFYLDVRLGVGRPPGFPMTLNNAVDTLLKKEFDIHRVKKTAHPLMKQYGVDAVPLIDKRLEEWRDALKRGIAYHHPESNLILRGGVDDVWVNPKGELIIVDYKATSKDEEITLNDAWKVQYKRQMEIYQWLFEQNGFVVSPMGYFVYVNGKTDKEAFDGKLEFDVTLLPYEGKTDWIPRVLLSIRQCLEDERVPKFNKECDYCCYQESTNKVLKKNSNEGRPKGYRNSTSNSLF